MMTAVLLDAHDETFKSNLGNFYLVTKMRSSDVEGKKVIGAGGRILGTVSGIEFDASSWKLTRLAVRLSEDAAKDLGLKKPILGHVEILVSVDSIKGISDVVTIDKAISELKDSVHSPKKDLTTDDTDRFLEPQAFSSLNTKKEGRQKQTYDRLA